MSIKNFIQERPGAFIATTSLAGYTFGALTGKGQEIALEALKCSRFQADYFAKQFLNIENGSNPEKMLCKINKRLSKITEVAIKKMATHITTRRAFGSPAFKKPSMLSGFIIASLVAPLSAIATWIVCSQKSKK